MRRLNFIVFLMVMAGLACFSCLEAQGQERNGTLRGRVYDMSGQTLPGATIYLDETKSGVVSDVHEIQRNDYIHVLVEVSYNPDKGDFEFVVNDWKTGGGEITFN